jgi:hypothetical protein
MRFEKKAFSDILIKRIRLRRRANQVHISARPVSSQEGRIAIVTNVEAGCDGRDQRAAW